MGDTVLEHDGQFTERDYLALAPRDGHVELVEGTLLVGPVNSAEHGTAVAAVRAALEKALPEGLRVVETTPLRLGHDCVLVPDLVIARDVPVERAESAESSESSGGEPASEEPAQVETGPEVLDCADVLIVVDVVDRTHGITQRSFKPQLYARSRIPYAVLVDSAAPEAAASMLISGRYHEFARAGAGERLVLEEPFRVEIDLTSLSGQGDQ